MVLESAVVLTAGLVSGLGGQAAVVMVMSLSGWRARSWFRRLRVLRSVSVLQVGGEEVQRQDPLRLRSQELRPARAIPARSRADPSVLEDPPGR
jgi:hypothetical protein